MEEVADAIQTACKRFLEHAEGISEPGQIYSWIRTTAHRVLQREDERHGREEPRKSIDGLAGLAAEEPGPAEELISSEDDADLAELVEEVYSSLPDRGREILALYGAGYKRPQIAERLGLSDRVVKRELLEVMDAARSAVARLAGGGCRHGEPLVLRSVCGLATAAEEAHAREHLARCGCCEIFSERLIAWREKAGAILPVPAAEGASPGLVERVLHKSAEGLSSIKQHIVDGGAQAKQQVAAGYYRAVDPTPLAVTRPGTVATALATCILAIGGGATYCVQQGVNPLGAARGLIASAPESEPEPPAPSPEPESTGPTYTPVEPTETEEAPAPEPTPTAEQEPDPKPKPKAEPPPPEDSFEPVSPAYASSEGGTEETYEASEAAPVESTQSAPAPAQPGPQFGGP
ncbi:MAG TPA: sigma-70 family RNA polymerase sigma factor [Solirubrobacterales bacterium]|jgi:RNA polymerase sigma factor (sigma-70 family)|nr:sigma-70 family RNA polymerase sigma factor [Solirubrobacterales bacterium]